MSFSLNRIVELVDQFCSNNNSYDDDSLYDLNEQDESAFVETKEFEAKHIDLSRIALHFAPSNLKSIEIENLYSHPNLGNLLNKLHYIIYLNLNQVKKDQEPSQIDLHMDIIDSIFDYLVSQPKPLRLNLVSSLILCALHSVASLVHFSQPNQRINAKTNSIMSKMKSLFETKLADLEEEMLKPTLFKTLKYIVYLIEHSNDFKCLIPLWKILSKLVFKGKVLVPIADKKMILIRKITALLFKAQKTNLNHIKTTLNQQDSSSSENKSTTQIQTLNSHSISSQMRLKNNVVQDENKMIKFSVFLFNILRTFLRHHLADISTDGDETTTNTFESLTRILVQINSILFDEQTGQRVDEDKNFHLIKLEFVKEYSQIYEQLLQHVLGDSKFVIYLNQAFVDRNDDDDNDEIINRDRFVLFYFICINKSSESFEFESTLEYIFKLLSLTQEAIYSPVYCTYWKKFTHDPKFDYNRLVADCDSLPHLRVDFYELSLLAVCKFVLQSGLNQNKLYYLVSNIASNNDPIRTQFSSDLMYYLIQNYVTTSNFANFTHLIKFISSLYETTNHFGLENLLLDSFNLASNSISTDLDQFYTQHKMYRCLHLLNAEKPNPYASLIINLVGYTCAQIDSLLQILSSNSNEVVVLRNSLQLVQTNKMPLIVHLCGEVLLRCVENKNLNGCQIGELALRLANKLTEFIKLDMIEKLLINIECQRPFFLLLLRVLHTCTIGWSMASTFDDELILFLLDFFLRICFSKRKSIALVQNDMLKLEAIEYLRFLAKRKQSLNNQEIQSKVVELFQKIFASNVDISVNNNPNSNRWLKYFALECLNEYCNSPEANKSSVLCQLSRLGYNQLISDHLIKIHIDELFNVSQFVDERRRRHPTTTVSTISQPSQSYDDTAVSSFCLDETMNVLISTAAMNTSYMVVTDDNDDDKMKQNKMSNIEADLRELINSYESGQIPCWLRLQLKNLALFISKNV